MHSIDAFYKAIADIQIIVVIAKDMMNEWKALCKTYHLAIPHQLAPGGSERFHSVKNGLALVDQEGIVAIHDAARPLVSNEIIRNTFHLAAIFWREIICKQALTSSKAAGLDFAMDLLQFFLPSQPIFFQLG